MDGQLLPHFVFLVAAASVSLVLIPFVVQNRDERGATALVGVLVAAVVWSAADAGQLLSDDRGTALVLHNFRMLASSLMSIAYLCLVLVYTNREQYVTRRTVAGMATVGAITAVMVWTGVGDHWVRAEAELVPLGSTTILEVAWGPWFPIHAGVNYSLIFLATILLLAEVPSSTTVGIHRKQVLAMLVAATVPMIASLSFTAGITPIDLTPAGFSITAVMLTVALFHYRFFDITPVARTTVVETMDDACLVLSKSDHVIDVNDRATAMLGRSRSDLVGAPITNVFAAYPEQLDRFIDQRDANEQLSIEIDSETYYFDVDVSPIHNQAGQYLGRTLLIHDVTDRVRRQQVLERHKAELEVQNERLDEFATVVSHDLRNPIAVIEGYLDVARAETDGHVDAHDEIEWATERMQTLIDDLLALAKEERDVVEETTLSLEAVSTEAWKSVHAEAATLEIVEDTTIQGDASRLRQAFENLFRNAVEHGSTSHADADASADAIDHGPEDVTITVGSLADGSGFFIEDDGPGIPSEKRASVFERGFTTSSDGTGFGLAIVARTVDAHGWSMSVTESDDGGARFEVTGVESTDPVGDRTLREPT